MGVNLRKVALAHLPTPVERADRLSRHLGGPNLFVKRDDLTGLAGGGNKTRKLEYLVADALEMNATTLITAGAPQSNHARQTAAAAARNGLSCVLVLGGQAPPAGLSGNLLLDTLLGARIHWAGARDLALVMDEVAAGERAAGRRPYVIPYGGSNALGAAAYVAAMQEMLEQTAPMGVVMDHVVVASSSGGTQAGLVLGGAAAGYRGKVWGISVMLAKAPMTAIVEGLIRDASALLGLPWPGEGKLPITVMDQYLGKGYGIMGEAERIAIETAAKTEGLILDPVYTGKAMAGLLDLVSKGAVEASDNVLFWHTGGTPALYAYGDEFRAP